MYKMIFIDIDGTLLNSKGEISPANKKAIGYANAKRVKVVLCSGRSYMDLIAYAKELGIYDNNCYISSYNGAMIVEGQDHKELHATMIPLERFQIILEKLQEKGNNFVIYPNATVNYIEKTMDEAEITSYYNISKMKYEVKESLSSAVTTDIFKIVAIGDKEYLEDLAAHVKPYLSSEVNMFFSSDRYLEFTAKEGTKGHAVKYLAHHFGVSPSETIAIGDNGNDESMILEAGLGVALNNAVESLKKIADVVSEHTNDEDGVAHTIYKYV